MQILTNNNKFLKDLNEIVNIFNNGNALNGVTVLHSTKNVGEIGLVSITELKKENETLLLHSTEFDSKKLKKLGERKCIQLNVYETLSSYTGIKKPWGALLGIRPVKLAKKLNEEGIKLTNLASYLKDTYYVSEEKSSLLIDVISNQPITTKNNKLINLYINIPFCPTRCSYCSFISCDMSKTNYDLDKYVKHLIKEIKQARKLIQENSYIVKTVYIGGGTPTVLNVTQLETLLKELQFNVAEFTVEAGRVDTLTDEKLETLKKYNVSRLSLNPQSFNASSLKAVNRPLDMTKFLTMYSKALSLGLDVNIDLIAGLPNETIKSFKEGLNTVIEMHPSNITLHSLSIKRAGQLQELKDADRTLKMFDYAYKTLRQTEYKPYYLYRQKNISGNLENVGFSLKNKACQFNIDTTCETTTTLAIGAGGVSKKIDLINNTNQRLANFKGIDDYFNRFKELLIKKQELFK